MWAEARTHHYDLNMIMWRYVDAKTPEEESPFVQNKSEFLEAKYIPVLLTMEVERREVCLECLLMNLLAH